MKSKVKGWILYSHGAEVGYFASLNEVGKEIGKSGAYMWQLYTGRHIGKDGQPKKETNDGYSIKPAKVIAISGK